MERYDLIIIGAGPGGLAAAAKAKECGVQSILILERNPEAGGILNQCIHDGFGVERFADGERVSHAIFGAGTVVSSRDMGGDILYEVRFDNGQAKKLMATFAKLKRM